MEHLLCARPRAARGRKDSRVLTPQARPWGAQRSAGTTLLREPHSGAGAEEKRGPEEGAWGTAITCKLEFQQHLTWLSGASGKAHLERRSPPSAKSALPVLAYQIGLGEPRI